MQYSYDIANYIPVLREYASKASFVLEIGPAKGDGSTRAFEEALRLRTEDIDRLFISVDREDYMQIKPEAKYWHLVIGDSRHIQTLEDVIQIAEAGRKADLIFIDTHHTYEQMQAELELWKYLAGQNTVWLFHDTYMMGEYNHMTDAIKEFAIKEDWVYSDLSVEAHGLGSLQKKNEN